MGQLYVVVAGIQFTYGVWFYWN